MSLVRYVPAPFLPLLGFQFIGLDRVVVGRLRLGDFAEMTDDQVCRAVNSLRPHTDVRVGSGDGETCVRVFTPLNGFQCGSSTRPVPRRSTWEDVEGRVQGG